MKLILENEALLRKHREDILKDSIFKGFKLEDFTLMSPESLRDNPFMRFIGFHYPVKVYRDVVYFKEHKVLRKVAPRKAQFRRPSRRRDSKSSTMSDEDDLLGRLLGMHRNIDRINEVEESKESEAGAEGMMIQDDEDESHYNIYDGTFSSDDAIEKELEKHMSPSAQAVSHREEETQSAESMKSEPPKAASRKQSSIPASRKQSSIPGSVSHHSEKPVAPVVPRKKAFTRIIPENDISKLMNRMGDRSSQPNVKD